MSPRRVFAGFGALTVGGLTARLARRHWFVIIVRGQSMAPTFEDGARVLVRRTPVGSLRVGDIVVFALDRALGPVAQLPADPRLRVKRVAAVAGDPTPAWMTSTPMAMALSWVPAGCLAVVGDNVASQGSRELGYVPEEAVIGWISHRSPRFRAGL